MKIALAQINPTVGDVDGNLARAVAALGEARDRGAGLCVLPAHALGGHPTAGLADRSAFVDACGSALERLAGETHGFAVVLGDSPGGRPVLLADGKVTRDRAPELGGLRLRLQHGSGLGPAEGADLIVHVAADPFAVEWRDQRRARLAEAARASGAPAVSVNAVGGNDDVVLAGDSIAAAADGTVVARARELAVDVALVDTDSATGDRRPPLPGDDPALIEALTVGIRDHAGKCGFGSAVLGLSGGIDSALVATLAVRALGPENVVGISMPSRYSSQGSRDDAAALAANLGIRYEVQPIDALFQAFLDQLAPLFAGREPDTTEENLQARLRGVLVMALANKERHLPLCTGNRSEAATGYATLYGDMVGGLAPLADLPKTTVFRLAELLNRDAELIPWAIIEKPPSAELAPGQKDEDSLPPYDRLDAILAAYLDEGRDAADLAADGFDEAEVRDVVRRVRLSEHKRRQAAPGIRVTAKAFADRRPVPVAQRFLG